MAELYRAFYVFSCMEVSYKPTGIDTFRFDEVSFVVMVEGEEMVAGSF